jgi:hypothetical protein
MGSDALTTMRQTPSPERDAVSQPMPAQAEPIVVGVLALDPTGCQAIDVGSQDVGLNVQGNGPLPGIFWVDSEGSKTSGANACDNSNDYTIEANNTSGPDKILASPSDDGLSPGIIALFALPQGATACLDGSVNHACEPGDILSGRINPQPIFEERATRSIVDHTFNCKDSYPDFPAGTNILQLEKCDNVVPDANGNGIPESAYIDELRYALGPGKNLIARGWRQFTTDPAILLPPGASRCNTPPELVLPVGNWWIDCTGAQGLNTNNALTFLGGNVVFEGKLGLGSNGVMISNPSPLAPGNPPNLPAACLTVLCPEQFSNNHAFMYFRGTDSVFSKGAQSQITLNHTAVIIENGRIDIAAGNGVLD